MPDPGRCPDCGRPLDAHDRHWRFTLPDVIAAVPEQDRGQIWQSEPDPRRAVLMQRDRTDGFLRALLPVRLTGGFTLTFGVWVRVRPADLHRAMRLWWAPEYRDLVVDGWLANAIAPWGLHGAPVTVLVRDPDQVPYCDSSPDPRLRRVLREQWPHESVLAAYG